MKRSGLTYLLIILAFIVFAPSYVYSEVLSLKQAVNTALKENPLLKAYVWSVESQRNELRTAKAYWYPKLTLEERFMRTDNPTYAFMAKLNQERFQQTDFAIDSLNNPDSISDFQTSLSIEQPVFVPRLWIGTDLAESGLEAKKREFERKKEEVVLKVIKAYLMVQTAREYVDVARKSLEDAAEHKRLAELRYSSGVGLYSDVLRAEVSLKEAEKRLANARSNYEIARRSLGLLLGKTEPVDVDEERPLFDLDKIDVYINASVGRKDLLSLAEKYKITRRAVDLEKATWLPELGVRGTYQFNDHNSPFGTEGDSYIVMAFLRWNFLDPTIFSRIKKAQARARELEEYLDGLKKEIRFRVHEAYIRVKEKETNLSLSRASVKEAEEARRLVRTRYENSLAPMVDLLDTQLMLDMARARLVEAENDYFSSIAELYYQSGILLQKIKVMPDK